MNTACAINGCVNPARLMEWPDQLSQVWLCSRHAAFLDADPIETGAEACAGELAACRDRLARLQVRDAALVMRMDEAVERTYGVRYARAALPLELPAADPALLGTETQYSDRAFAVHMLLWALLVIGFFVFVVFPVSNRMGQ